MKFSLTYNGQIISNENLSEFTNQCADWEKEIPYFLEEWASESKFITVQTSGSTGKPKLIQLLKEDMITSATMTCDYFNLKNGDAALLCLPVKYIAGKMMLVRAITRSLKLISIQPTSSPELQKVKKTEFAAMTPMQVNNALTNEKSSLGNIKKLIIGGGPVDRILEDKLQEIPTACFSTFGMTETITHVALKRLNGEAKSDYFEALNNITFEAGNEGELIIHTPYNNNSTLTTNDVVQLSGFKSFKWIGRIDNIINSGGVKHSPEVIEEKLKKIISPERFFIASQPDQLLGEALILIIESENYDQIKNIDFSSVLDKIETPKKVYLAPKFTETETGKINRKETLLKIKIEPLT